MKKIRIGVWDEEKEYVTRLTMFLQRYGKGKWEVSAFTDKDSLCKYLEKGSLDILVGTDKGGLKEIEKKTDLIKLWLSDEEKSVQLEGYVLYRFQSAEVIGRNLKEIVKEKLRNHERKEKLVAIYSPIGRCGKTTFALGFVNQSTFGKWIYIGLEDYSSFDNDDEIRKMQADEFLYYWKEHNEEEVKKKLETADNVIVSGHSFFDARQMETCDYEWIRQVIKDSNYAGAVFDIGCGVLQDFQMLKVFDVVIVPYVDEESAWRKRKNFEALLHYQEMEAHMEHLHYLNMTKKTEQTKIIQQIFGGDGI